MIRMLDITGKQFGRLVAIKPCGNSSNGNTRWLCKCNCGNHVIVDGYQLRHGMTRSCGCLRKEKMHDQYFSNPSMVASLGEIKHLRDENGIAYVSLKPYRRNNSGTVGVSFDRASQKWIARLMVDKRYVLNKSFLTFEEACEARQNAEKKYF